MPGQGTIRHQMPGHGTMSQQIPGQGNMSQLKQCQVTASHQVTGISSHQMGNQYSGAVSYSVPGQGAPSLLNTHIPAKATLGQTMPGHGTATTSQSTLTHGTAAVPHQMPGQGAISGQQAINQQLPPQQQAMTSVQNIQRGIYSTQENTTHGQPGTIVSQTGNNFTQPHITSTGSSNQTSVGQPKPQAPTTVGQS